VVAAAGYPGQSRVGDIITGADSPGVFHAGTVVRQGQLLSSGGRILSCTATGATLAQARERAYALVAGIELAGAQFRTDIALAASLG
jgi:phosphoribosylamine--glycine ligase